MISNTSVSGYVPSRPLVHRAYNAIIAAMLILASLPLMVAISVALILTQGTDIIYRGTRIGQGMREFRILKFRTLDSARARELTSTDVLRDGTNAETRLGGFLRATRLDELPQLFNVLCGDMNLVGPRPVRPEIAAIYRQEIPYYDTRFSVKPGLMGWTQALMSHGASKHLRARLNFVACRAPVRYLDELHLMALVASCVIGTTVRRLIRKARKLLSIDGPARAGRIGVSVQCDESRRSWPAHSWDKNEIVLGGYRPDLALGECATATLVIRLPDGHLRRARVHLNEPRVTGEGTGVAYGFSPRTAYSDHVLDRYMHLAAVTPHKSLLLIARIRRRLRTLIGAMSLTRRVPRDQAAS